MNILTLTNVTSVKTSTVELGDHACEFIRIKTQDGQSFTIRLMMDPPEVTETERLITSIKESLARWGLEDYPDHERLVTELYHEATKPDNEDINLDARSFVGCLTWSKADADLSFWLSVDTWAKK